MIGGGSPPVSGDLSSGAANQISDGDGSVPLAAQWLLGQLMAAWVAGEVPRVALGCLGNRGDFWAADGCLGNRGIFGMPPNVLRMLLAALGMPYVAWVVFQKLVFGWEVPRVALGSLGNRWLLG